MEFIDEASLKKAIESSAEMAKAFQKCNCYCGEDDYKNEVLKGEEQEIYFIKTEPSWSGYFLPREEYEALRDNDGLVSAKAIAEKWQLLPSEIPNTGLYGYRSEVSIFKLEKNIEAGVGEHTTANMEYGTGQGKQIFIQGYEKGNEEQNRQRLGLVKVGEEKLKDYVISTKEYKEIMKKNKCHLAKRDLFLYQTAKEKLLQLKTIALNPDVLKICDKKLLEVNAEISRLEKFKIKNKKIMGNLPCQTYDELNKYLAQKNAALERGEKPQINPELEMKAKEQNNAWMHKIKEELKLVPNKREVQVDDLMNAYKTNVFCNVGIQKELREQLAESQKLQRAEEKLLNQGEKPQKWFTMERLKKNPIIQNRGNVQLGGEARMAGKIANKAAKVANVGRE